MKGLLCKDFLMLQKYLWAFLIILGVFVAVAVLGERYTFFLLYPLLLTGMMPIGLLAQDEKNGWLRCADTLPCSRKTVVDEKYLLALLLLGACLILYLLSQAGAAVYTGRFQPGALISGIGLLCSIGLLAPAVLLAAAFRMGAEKGLLAYFIILLGVYLLFSAIVGIFFDRPGGGEASLNALPGWVLLYFLVVLSAAAFGISRQMAAGYYQQREL